MTWCIPQWIRLELSRRDPSALKTQTSQKTHIDWIFRFQTALRESKPGIAPQRRNRGAPSREDQKQERPLVGSPMAPVLICPPLLTAPNKEGRSSAHHRVHRSLSTGDGFPYLKFARVSAERRPLISRDRVSSVRSGRERANVWGGRFFFWVRLSSSITHRFRFSAMQTIYGGDKRCGRNHKVTIAKTTVRINNVLGPRREALDRFSSMGRRGRDVKKCTRTPAEKAIPGCEYVLIR